MSTPMIAIFYNKPTDCCKSLAKAHSSQTKSSKAALNRIHQIFSPPKTKNSRSMLLSDTTGQPPEVLLNYARYFNIISQ